MRRLIPLLLTALLAAACSSIDCPMNNMVLSKYKLAGDVETIGGSLTVSTARNWGGDTVLLNSISRVDSFYIPMSYAHEEDVLVFDYTTSEGDNYLDTVVIEKTDMPHFEAIDCNPVIFHELKNVRHTHNALDSIVIKNAHVTYDANTNHFYVYFRSDI